MILCNHFKCHVCFKMEFAVQMESSACEEEIRTALAGHDGRLHFQFCIVL